MKKLIFTLSMVFIVSLVISQTGYYYNGPPVTPGGNPGNLNNNNEKPYGGGLAFGWTDIQPSTVPAWTAVQTIPFTFKFNDAVVTSFKVHTSGVLTFTTSATADPGPHVNIPSGNIPNNSICVWGIASGDASSNDHIVTKTFGQPGQRQLWIFFDSYSTPPGGNCYVYWSIVLEETTNKIYIVDQMTKKKNSCSPPLTLGIQINSSTAIAVAGSPNIYALASSYGDGQSDNEYYEFIPGQRPQYDMSVDWIQTNPFQSKTSIEIRGTLVNFGSLNVTSYNVNYQFDNDSIYTDKVTISNIPQLGTDWYFHSKWWLPDTVGIYHLKVWCDSINGGHVDQKTSNDTCYKTIEVMGIFVPRLVFHEVFSSSASEECKDGNDTLNKIFTANPGKYAVIKYQQSPDIYSTVDGDARKSFYGVDSIPDMYVNGTSRIDPRYYEQVQFQSFPAAAYLSITNVSFVRNGNAITIKASLLPLPEWTNPTTPLKLHIALVEKVTHNNASTNGETEFHYVLKKMVPDAGGSSIGPFQPNFFVNVTKSYTFPTRHTVENLNNLQGVIFVQDDVTKEIFQSGIIDGPQSIPEI
ncbi:MAG: hypothetical protein K9J13_13755, partial [Saprospiraceae bacterium]|nr:hypothetical protein [Saprospiraceae bacterium]